MYLIILNKSHKVKKRERNHNRVTIIEPKKINYCFVFVI